MSTFTSKRHITRLLLDTRKGAGAARFFLSAVGERAMRNEGKSETDSLYTTLRCARRAATNAEEAVTCIEDRMRERRVHVPEAAKNAMELQSRRKKSHV